MFSHAKNKSYEYLYEAASSFFCYECGQRENQVIIHDLEQVEAYLAHCK